MTEEVTNTEDKKNKDLVVFLDTIGRTIIAERTGESSETITVQNPAVVNIAPQTVVDPNTGQPAIDPNTGQPIQRMALQLFPLFFREFLAEKDNAVGFKFKKDSITMTSEDIVLDYKVVMQYEGIFAVVGDINPIVNTPQEEKPATEEAAPSNVIQLFDK